MRLQSKMFHELTARELYEILKARVEIFVVEQNCVYQDLDDRDYQSLHVFFEEENRVTAYLRAFWKADGCVQMGRVLTMRHGTGLGGRLLREGITQIRDKLNPERIYLEAQCYAEGFYGKHGFQKISDKFMLDGILHYKMLRP